MNTKFTIISSILLLLISCSSGKPFSENINQTNSKILKNEVTKNIEPVIPLTTSEKQEIEAYVKEIDKNLKSYLKCEDSILGLSTEGTGVFSYYDKGILVKITPTYYGESFKTEENIYLKNGDLIYANELRKNYTMKMRGDDIYTDYNDITLDPLDQLYFRNGELSDLIRDNKSIDNNSEDFLSKADAWRSELKDLKIEKISTRKECPHSDK